MRMGLHNEANALFVDLANFYSRLLQSDLGEPELLQKYFAEWFDFSLLSIWLAGDNSDVWIFYSGNKLGPKKFRLDELSLKSVIARFDKQRGVTARDVNIPGEQREPFTTKCESCGSDADAIWKSEKGIDSTLIVHLFDTLDSWRKAYLVSGDADFVPAVRSLRRRGKIINSAGFLTSASSALVKECFESIDLLDFFKQDIALYSLFGSNGHFATTLEKYLIRRNVQHKARVIIEIGYISGGSETHLRLESNILNFELVRQDFVPLRVDQKLSEDKHELTFHRCFYEFVYPRVLNFFKRFGSYVHTPVIRPETIGHRCYVEYEWNTETNRYEPR